MAKYIKNPVLIDAIEYKPGLEDGYDEIEVVVNTGIDIEAFKNMYKSGKIPYIQTLEGKHYIKDDDFIVTGVDGERYPCKRSIFLKTYTFIRG